VGLYREQELIVLKGIPLMRRTLIIIIVGVDGIGVVNNAREKRASAITIR